MTTTMKYILFALFNLITATDARLGQNQTIDMGDCSRFSVHGFAGVAAAPGPTLIYGDVGGDNAITGFGTGSPLPHVYSGYGFYSVTPESAKCAAEKQIIYNTLKGSICNVTDTETDLSGVTLTPGVFCNSAGFFTITSGNLVLDGNGRNDSVFIFQAATSVVTSINTNVILINGAQSKNVYWQAGSAINIAGYSTFKGNLFAYSTVTFGTYANLSGRAMASTASVTLAGGNVISLPELSVNDGSDL
jgi:hypothetical protein